MKLVQNIVSVVIIALTMIGCASTEYTSYEGSTVTAGTGGARDTVDGIDIWTEGTPPRKYKVIGVINDTRGAGWASMAGLKSGLAKKAKEKGGDAVILRGTSTQYVGQTGNYSSSTGTFNSTAMFHASTSALVIKYVK